MAVRIIYATCNQASGEACIGETCHPVIRRAEHRGALRRGRHSNRALQAAWDRDGAPAFGLFVLERIGEPPIPHASDLRAKRREDRWTARVRSAGVVLDNDQVRRGRPEVKVA